MLHTPRPRTLYRTHDNSKRSYRIVSVFYAHIGMSINACVVDLVYNLSQVIGISEDSFRCRSVAVTC